jgi:regulator of PEP synthase PpsR (kinase-PPPase family)
MIAAFLTQFAPGTFHPILLTFLESDGKVANALEQVAQLPGPVMHALVSQRSKEMVAEFAARHGLPYCDLTGGFVEFLARAAGTRPLADVRRLHHIDESYHRRIGAIEFTLQHDDGLGLDTIGEADVVLVGVSRTSKTPTSIYLAQQGYKVANVSLAMGVTPPAEVDELPPNRTVGLVIDPGRLVEIRSARQVEWRMTTTDYNRRDAVEREVAWSRRLFRDRGWPVLDVTNHAVEETAGRVVSALGLGTPGAPRPAVR